MNYVFDLRPIEGEKLLEQLSAVLEARTELVSRAKYPRMWRMTDRMYGGPRPSKEALRRRRIRYRIWGGVLFALGVFLLLPAMTRRNASLLPMLMGAFSLFMALQAFRWSSDKGLVRADFDDPARKLLAGLSAPGRLGGRVTFSKAGVELKPSSGESAAVAYQDIDFLFETEDLIVFTDGVRIIVLRKEELAQGDMEGLRSLFIKKTKNYIDLRA